MRDPVATLSKLACDPYAYDFFAALRLLECAYPDKPRIGQSLRPHDDAVRFGQSPSLAFEHTMLASFKPAADGVAAKMDVNFMGLLGANGPLPIHLTEYIRDRLRNSADPTLARFLDVFHHRMIALFYRAWASAQPVVSLDRPEADRFSDYVASLIGIGMKSLHQRDAVPDFAKLHYAGHLSSHIRNADGLAQILTDFFKVPVVIQEFVGHWMSLPSDGLLRLRTGPDAPVLGVTSVLGSRVWNCQDKFRIIIGPLTLVEYMRLLPGGNSFKRLKDWVRNYVGITYDWDVNLILKKGEFPPLKFGKQAQLGRVAWLSSNPSKCGEKHVLINPNHQPSPIRI